MGQGVSGFNGGGVFLFVFRVLTGVMLWTWRPLGRPCSWGFGGISVAAGAAAGGFAFTASHFCRRPKVTKTLGPGVRPARWGSGFLRSGIDPGASLPVCFAAPPFDVFDFVERRYAPTPRINPSTQPAEGAGTARSRAAAELTLILLSGEKRSGAGGYAVFAFAFALALAFVFLWERACS